MNDIESEAVTMAEKIYGAMAKAPVNLAMDVLRDERAISYDEFRVMMPRGGFSGSA